MNNNNDNALFHQKCLSEREINIFNGELIRSSRSIVLSYILLIITGPLGLHKFYLGKPIKGIIYAILTITGLLTLYLNSGIFVVALAIPIIALIWDIFTIPHQLKERENKIRENRN